MAVKVAPAQGEVLVEEKRTRVEHAVPPKPEDQHGNRKHPEMWSWMESLTPADWQTKDYEMTIYRGTKSGPRGAWCGKFYEPMTPDKIQGRFGGGQYVIYFKVATGSGGPLQLRYFEDLEIVGAPKNDFEVTPAQPAPNDALGQVLAIMREEMRAFREEMRQARGGDAATEAVRSAINLNGEVFKTGLTTLQTVLQPTARVENPLIDRLMTLAIERLLVPPSPVDPIKQFGDMVVAMKGLGLTGGTERSGIGVELVRGFMGQAPNLAAHFSNMMANYARAKEAEAQALALTRGAAPRVIQATAVPQPAQPQPQPAAQPEKPNNVVEMPPPTAPDTAASPENQAEMLMQYIETKIVELIMDSAKTPQEAADTALAFIETTDRTLLPAILQYGEEGLKWAFSNRGILQRVPKGPRLDEFIKEFIEGAREVPVPDGPDPKIPPA